MSATKSPPPERCEVCIATALQEELDAVIETLKLAKDTRGNRNYYYGNVECSDGGRCLVVAGLCREKSNLPASQFVLAMVSRWKPKYVLMVGIGGGIDGREGVVLGDVVVSDVPIAYYEFKTVREGVEKEQVLTVEPPSPILLDNVDFVSTRKFPWWESIQLPRPDESANLPKVIRGQVLSGDKLLDDPESPLLIDLLAEHEKAVAVDMESGGAARACLESRASENGSIYRVEYLTIRGISDYCNLRGNKAVREKWKKYAAQSAAAFAESIIEEILTSQVTTQKEAYDEYCQSFEDALQAYPIATTEFQISFKSKEGSNEPVKSLINITLNKKRVSLRGAAGGGKSLILAKFARELLRSDVVPIYLDLKAWKTNYAIALAGYDVPLDRKLDAVLNASIADVNPNVLNEFKRDRRIFIFVDGLNEVYGEGPVREIIGALDSYVRQSYPKVCVLTTDRLLPRPFLGTAWFEATLNPIDSPEVQRHIDGCFGEGVYEKLSENEKAILEIPYFLDYALKAASPSLGSKSTAIKEYFSKQIRLDDGKLDRLCQAAFAAYKKYRSPSFDVDEFRKDVGEEIWEKLAEARAILSTPGGYAKFDHQLKHDFLASRDLVSDEKLWTPPSFDAVSLQSNSFDGLTMVVEQITEISSGDRFLKLLYDWNWFATVTCIAAASKQDLKRFSTELEGAVVALVAEKVFDPVQHTSTRAKKYLPDIPLGRKMGAPRNFKDIVALLEAINSEVGWFLRWRNLFTRREAKPKENEICLIIDSDPIIGWTVSNVVRLFDLDEKDEVRLHSYYEAFEGDSSKQTMRWRIVHALGRHGTPKNIAFLLRALDGDEYMWVRYGAVRSLVEIAARVPDNGVRRGIRDALLERESSMSPKVLEEIGDTVFYSGALGDWRSTAVQLLQRAIDVQKIEGDKDRWKKTFDDFERFLEANGNEN